MKKALALLVIAVIVSSSLFAQETKSAANKKFMQINTVESVIVGGMGRSK
jgi:hypothetical protein